MPALITTYGNFATALLLRERYRRRYDGLDEGSFTLVNNNADSYKPGSYYGNTGFRIREDDAERNGQVWEHNLSTVGIKGGKSVRRLKRTISYALEGFDTANEIWLTTNANLIKEGARMSGYNNMVCESSVPEDLEDSGWFTLRASFRGIARAKAIKRTITSNGKIISLESVVNGLPGGWSNARKGEFQWPNLVVTFRYWTTYIPKKTLPQQGGTAPGELYPVVEIEGLSSDTLTSHWPHGWRLSSFASDPISGTEICENAEVWEYQQKVTF